MRLKAFCKTTLFVLSAVYANAAILGGIVVITGWSGTFSSDYPPSAEGGGFVGNNIPEADERGYGAAEDGMVTDSVTNANGSTQSDFGDDLHPENPSTTPTATTNLGFVLC